MKASSSKKSAVKSVIKFFVVERGAKKMVKTKGFRDLGKIELVMHTTDTTSGIKVLSSLSEKILNQEVVIKENVPVMGIIAVPLVPVSGILDGEEVIFLVPPTT